MKDNAQNNFPIKNDTFSFFSTRVNRKKETITNAEFKKRSFDQAAEKKKLLGRCSVKNLNTSFEEVAEQIIVIEKNSRIEHTLKLANTRVARDKSRSAVRPEN